MKKMVLLLLIVLSTVVGCSNQESKKIENKATSTVNEEAKFWKVTESGFESGNESFGLIGEVGKFGFLDKTLKVDQKDKYTFILWVEDKAKLDEMIGKKVELYGISEKSTEKLFLTTSTIEKLSNDDPKVPMNDLSVKFDAVLKLIRTGKWKIEAHVDDHLLGSTILFVEHK
jgi:hypothetical protein